MNFIGLFIYLEESLGYHLFPVNRDAADLASLYESSGSHHDLVVRLAHAIYKANRCQATTSPITRERTEEALSKVRLAILEGKKTDIDLYHFIEDVCLAINEFFGLTEDAKDPHNDSGPGDDRPEPEVVRFRKHT